MRDCQILCSQNLNRFNINADFSENYY